MFFLKKWGNFKGLFQQVKMSLMKMIAQRVDILLLKRQIVQI